MSEQGEQKFESWAVLELMGHRRLGGFVSEATLAGGAFLRIDVPGAEPGKFVATQYYSPGSVYALTPTTEEAARAVAKRNRPEPMHRWELPERSEPRPAVEPDDAEFDDDDGNGGECF